MQTSQNTVTDLCSLENGKTNKQTKNLYLRFKQKASVERIEESAFFASRYNSFIHWLLHKIAMLRNLRQILRWAQWVKETERSIQCLLRHRAITNTLNHIRSCAFTNMFLMHSLLIILRESYKKGNFEIKKRFKFILYFFPNMSSLYSSACKC